MQSAFAWPGGKRALVPTLLKLLPEHKLYVEVFAGSAKLLFAKPPSHREVMNDLNGDIANFFRVAKHRPAELAERLEVECVHAERFRELRAAGPPPCEIERALRFAYLVWYSFGAKGEHFASSNAKGTHKRSLGTIREMLKKTADRLASVLIEQRDYADILSRYDGESTCFYLDPPYVKYQHNGRYEPLLPARREEMFAAIAGLKGRCLVSFDDHPEIRAHAAYHALCVRAVTVSYTLCGADRPKQGREILVANYDIAA